MAVVPQFTDISKEARDDLSATLMKRVMVD